MEKNILSFRPYRKVIVGGHRAYNIDKALSELGVNIEIIEGWENFRVRLNTFRLLTFRQIENRMKLKKFIKNKNKYSRFLVHGVQPIKFMQMLKKTKIPIILDFRDDPLLQGKLIGIEFSQKKEEKIKKMIETSMEISDIILFPSETLMQHYSMKVQGKSIIIKNGTDPKYFKSSALPDNHVIGSLSGMVSYSGYELLIDSCKIVKKEYEDIQLILLNSPKGNYSKRIKETYSCDWIKFIDEMPYQQISSFFEECYLMVYSGPKTFYMDAATPLKIFDMMSHGRPFVTTNLNEIALITENDKCGLVCDHTPESMAEKIALIIKNRKFAQKIGSNGRKAAEKNHSWTCRAQTLLDYIY